jgi:hypothetical protein
VLCVKDMDPNFKLTEEESSVLKLTAVPEMERVEEPALVFIPNSWSVYLWDPSVKMLMPFDGPHANQEAIVSCTGKPFETYRPYMLAAQNWALNHLQGNEGLRGQERYVNKRLKGSKLSGRSITVLV